MPPTPLTLRAAADLIASANSLDGLALIAAAIGFEPDAATLDLRTRTTLGLDGPITGARVATGASALRAVLLTVRDGIQFRDILWRLAARLASRTPHVLWPVIATQPQSKMFAIAAWSDARRPPRVVALLADRSRLVDSDAETLRALAAASGSRDVLTHAHRVEILGRDALSLRFYRTLERTIAAIAASAPTGSDEARAEIALLHASRLLFLAFLEAKGWLDGDRSFLPHAFDRCIADGGGFHERVLRPLFFGTLNTPVGRRAPTASAFGSIPFLNGGLFARTPLERRSRGVSFGDDAYGALIYDLFGQYRFTAREESASWSEAAVDPEMLGRAFESLMASRERRRTGAFFTPFPLVEQLTVLDPACGSGAFLVYALERLAGLLTALGDDRDLGTIRRDVLTRSIFGVDMSPTAVWLCELRLWLSVVIENDATDPVHQRSTAARTAALIARHGGAILADPVGLGKTYTALAVAPGRGGRDAGRASTHVGGFTRGLRSPCNHRHPRSIEPRHAGRRHA